MQITEARIGHRELELRRKPPPSGGERGEFEGGWAVYAVDLTRLSRVPQGDPSDALPGSLRGRFQGLSESVLPDARAQIRT